MGVVAKQPPELVAKVYSVFILGLLYIVWYSLSTVALLVPPTSCGGLLVPPTSYGGPIALLVAPTSCGGPIALLVPPTGPIALLVAPTSCGGLLAAPHSLSVVLVRFLWNSVYGDSSSFLETGAISVVMPVEPLASWGGGSMSTASCHEHCTVCVCVWSADISSGS